MNRRLMMVQTVNSENWDLNWNYKQGLLSNYLTAEIDGGATETITDKGLLLTAIDTGNDKSHAGFVLPTKTSNRAILEILFEIERFSDFDGFYMRLSQGTSGCAVFIQKEYLGVEYGGTAYGPVFMVKQNLSKNTNYLLRLEYDSQEGYKITLDSQLIYQGKLFSNYYCTQNMLRQQRGGRTYLKEVRFKHIA